MINEYSIKEISADEYKKLMSQYKQKIFSDEQIFYLKDALPREEQRKLLDLGKVYSSIKEIYLALYYEGSFVGWSFGYQESAYRFYMCNSAVFPEHRRKGLYTKLMGEMIARVEKLGFQEIYSRHTSTNNAVIIPKLKAGFVISSIEVSDIFGVLVHLSYYPNKLRRKILDYRVGQLKPDNEIKKHLKFD